MGKHKGHDVVKVEKLLRGDRPCLALCAGKDCARNGAKQVIRAAQQALEEAGLADTVDFALTKCQDYCDEGPAMTVLPGGYPYVELTAEAAREIVLEHIRDGRPVVRRLHRRARRRYERRMA